MSAVAVAAAAQGPAPPVPAGAVWMDIGASLTTYYLVSRTVLHYPGAGYVLL